MAELTSGVGAVVLGIGIGVLAARQFSGAGSMLLLAGLLLHGWGMFDKHRLDSAQAKDVWWSIALYWICWALLAALAAYLVLRIVRR